MEEMYQVSSAPHVRAKETTGRVMLYVILALLPTSIYGIYNFGWRALLVIIVSISACVLSELVFDLIVHKSITVKDLSAVVTGLLLALNMPVAIPLWEVAIGGIFAIVVVKMLFGGLGQNFMNPALGARCFMLIAFAADMTNFTSDAYSTATPLARIDTYGVENVDVMKMLYGNTNGCIGETSMFAIMIGAVILIMLGVIDLKIPASYLLSFAAFISVYMIIAMDGFDARYLAAQICGGGLLLGAFFMATDYVTSPITPTGKIIFGICCGLLTAIFRCFGSNTEGVSFAIILSNLLVPIIEKHTIPCAAGHEKDKKTSATKLEFNKKHRANETDASSVAKEDKAEITEKEGSRDE
ncbi:MAG: RnfABCDGE type electron transport complex subunit D [Clostridiales bacterium]|nr:RnfABCDGE type electron transport complex subunit D [Clostridiales bacterium]